MIQRVQTLYLLSALALILICCLMPIAVLASSGPDLPVSLLELTFRKSTKILEFLTLFLLGYATFTNVLCIFLYKRRKTQMKQCMVNIFMLIVLNLLVLVQLLYLKNSGTTVTIHVILIFPLLAAVCTWLAYVRIKKDEELVRSNDRLR